MSDSRFEQFDFQLAPEVAQLGVTGAFLVMRGLRNRAGDPTFDALLAEATREIVADAVADDPVLQGYRQLHDAIKRSNKRFVAAPENLLHLVLQRGTIPRVNLLVDIYNLVSLQTRLALGAHDLARVAGNIELRLTRGTEPFHPLGIAQPTTVGPGEYAYVDGAGDVLCRLEVRQSEKTKVTLETTEAFFIIQGNRATPTEALQAAADELVRLTTVFCGGEARQLYRSKEFPQTKP
jgi:DNA/RNA-binding domain of Phe-tRNA-synthetase-like protein